MKKATRFTALACTVLLVSSMLAACGPKDAAESGPEDQDTSQTASEESTGSEKDIEGSIRYFTWTEEQVDGINESIQAFNKEYPNIKVDLQTAPWDQYWSKMQTEIAGGTCADVFMNQTWYFKTLQESGAAEPLTPLIERDGYSF